MHQEKERRGPVRQLSPDEKRLCKTLARALIRRAKEELEAEHDGSSREGLR